MKRANVRFNYNDYVQLPEDKRYEILDGDLFMVPAPGIKHQQASLNLLIALFQHIRDNGLGRLLAVPCDVILSNEDIVQPDILFIRNDHSGIVGELNIQGDPDLVIEILSPGTRAKDLEIKRKLYARFGVQEYWIVDPAAETVEVLIWSATDYATAGTFGKSDRLSSPLLPDLGLLLVEVF
jgi:Uma2 family endonuclease